MDGVMMYSDVYCIPEILFIELIILFFRRNYYE